MSDAPIGGPAQRSASVGFVALAVLLPGVAGAVNGMGLLAVGSYTSHVTGAVARMGNGLAEAAWQVAGVAAAIWLSFLVGASASALLVLRSKERGHPRFVLPLLCEAGLLLLALSLKRWGTDRPMLEAGLLASAMGAQNALVTKLSGSIIRTTHMTGITTDIGIGLARIWSASRRIARSGEPPAARSKLLRAEPEVGRLALHGWILASFFGGGLLGPLLYLRLGAVALALPIAIVLGIAAVDASVGLSAWLPAEAAQRGEAQPP
ncbi:MAG: YoaK family protein [Deltaproteobacteria bacterium]